MSPIRRDGIKQSGAMTPEQEGGSEGNTDPCNPEDDIEEKVRHSNRNGRREFMYVKNTRSVRL